MFGGPHQGSDLWGYFPGSPRWFCKRKHYYYWQGRHTSKETSFMNAFVASCSHCTIISTIAIIFYNFIVTILYTWLIHMYLNNSSQLITITMADLRLCWASCQLVDKCRLNVWVICHCVFSLHCYNNIHPASQLPQHHILNSFQWRNNSLQYRTESH